MIEALREDPKLSRYLISFHQGQNLFLEGDESQDLYVLVEGELDVLKGEQVISILSEPGTLFGEMSFLMGDKRTASIRGRSQGKALAIPRTQARDFLVEFPELGQNMARVLAQRLEATSNQLFGLKEFCDMLPDAVVLTNQDGRITALNRAAMDLYGRDWAQAGHQSVDALFEDGSQVRSLTGEVKGGQTCQEQVVCCLHPQEGTRFVSLSLSGLRDAQHAFKGLLLVGRDVTSVERLKLKMRRLRGWLIAALVALVVCLGGLVAYPYFYGSAHEESQLHAQFGDQLMRDHLLLSSLLAESLSQGRQDKGQELLRRFFAMAKNSTVPYTGVVILDNDKKVVESYYPRRGGEGQRPGASYAHIPFEGERGLYHRVLNVFHQGSGQEGSWRELLVAFPLGFKGQRLGWLLIGLDPQLLDQRYGLDQKELADLKLTPAES